MLAFVASAVAPAAGGKSMTTRAEAWRSLVKAERDFSADARLRGVRDAFLAHFADDCRTFPPGKPVVVGNAELAKQEKRPGLLSWYPVKAEVSRTGDLGYTTGPWEFRPQAATDAPVAWGHYVSVWRRRTDGIWTVALDFGSGTPKPAAGDPSLADRLTEPAGVTVAPGTPEAAKKAADEIRALDAEFAQAARKDGYAKAFLARAAPDVRLYREGQAPGIGTDAAGKMAATWDAGRSVTAWRPEYAEASAGGDFGYTVGYGALGGDGGESAAVKYTRFWRREEGKGPWRLVLENANAAAPAQQQP